MNIDFLIIQKNFNDTCLLQVDAFKNSAMESPKKNWKSGMDVRSIMLNINHLMTY